MSEEVFSFDSYNLFLCALVTWCLQMTGFAVAYTCQFDKITDLLGATNFLLLQLMLLFINASYSTRQVVTAILISAWALRLSGYLFLRILTIGEDKRFEDRRDFLPFLGFWTFQAIWVFVVSLPATFIAGIDDSDVSVKWWDAVAWIAFVIGLVIEAVADQQKFAFRNNSANKGKFCDVGLWSISRHPNYFGEILLWWAMFASGASVYHVSPGTWSAVLSPIIITTLLLFVSGLPLLEKGSDERYGHTHGYAAYKKRTPILIPFPPPLYNGCSPGLKALCCCEWSWYAADMELGTVTSSTSLTSDAENGNAGAGGYSASYESIKSDWSESEWKSQLQAAAVAGITHLLHDCNAGNEALDDDRLALLARVAGWARELGLEYHVWYLILLCNRPEVLEDSDRAGWYAIARDGSSARHAPPHAAWCHFLCPSAPDAVEFVLGHVEALALVPGAAGVHLDYIRTPSNRGDASNDAINYCYCSRCGGPDGAAAAVQSIVARAADALAVQNRLLTAAVYPMHADAAATVNQRWPLFPLAAVLPMAYPTYHGKTNAWIADVADDARAVVDASVAVIPGLLCEAFASASELRSVLALLDSHLGPSDGIAFFTLDTYLALLTSEKS
ncbi:uncharacterized protein AMSG_02181 [Thecamonas trahens ATCC 50062]|uniref:Steroid 5-alpha reductase C-terminal domain-containing protein n=1 Tax=Thecamonas trahens ATCC 50062 TaxID=461836 RepID=A0A0L0DV44_THETB|nr:hypothetical protein AMSG_02181 [Thecamonas trahens ATCC 50062]KNC56164.1 hypothetical protein AMSG_02181 [Thecamonas trahens ATCC 50062]|eukprot:XP_013761200.1 hypothetical protein AMSG_02181 [Thecamonas trahens ATCC 50062]